MSPASMDLIELANELLAVQANVATLHREIQVAHQKLDAAYQRRREIWAAFRDEGGLGNIMGTTPDDLVLAVVGVLLAALEGKALAVPESPPDCIVACTGDGCQLGSGCPCYKHGLVAGVAYSATPDL